jgi:hypothetical protein
MGFLKKITRPISRALDKIIPNEVKPALPFLAAVAPFMAPGLMGLGGNTMLSRALMSGGLNLGSQLAQEGSDGDFSALSLAMASGIGALSAPNAASTIRGVDPNFVGPRPAAEGILGQGKEYLARGAEFLGPQTGGVTDILGKGGTQAGLNMETLKAASIPFTQGTTDLAVAENRRAMRDYERELADYEAGIDSENSNRAFAIRQSMEAYGFTEQEILDAIEAAGYANGGRVGLANGGDLKEAALNNILYRFGGKYDRPTSSGDSLEDKITEKQLGDVLKYDFQGPAGVMGLEESLDMITPESVSRSAMKMQRDGDPDFGGIPAAVESVEEKPKEFLVDKLKVTVQPGQSEQMAIMNAMMNDIDEVMPEDRKMEFYKLYLPQLRASGEISENEYEGLMGELFGEGKAEGGIMDLGGREMDMRTGGFIPIGKKERADDVPARLSKNEFVMTADAVRAAGGGSVNEGARRMYNLMNNLEAKV